MPDWLHDSAADAELASGLVLERLIGALLLGCLVGGLYRITHGREADESRGLLATLVLLTILICMLTLVIGTNGARAFTLVGALAIVRFRTVVSDTRDTAFVIFAVCVGMGVGAGFYRVLAMGVPVVVIAALIFRPRNAPGVAGLGEDFLLTLRYGAGIASQQSLRQTIASGFASSRLTGASTARQGASIEESWAVRVPPGADAAAIIVALNRVEGVQDVQMHRA